MTREEKEQFRHLVERLDERDAAISELQEILPTLKKLAEAWESAAWFGRAVKWAGGIAAAIAAILAAIKLGFHK